MRATGTVRSKSRGEAPLSRTRGADHARIMLIGEQPGLQEDLQGLPFVGPAGRLLDEALEEAHLDRTTLYLTNTVKHFKYELRGKARLHASPGS
ncbi:MAG TPA: uracil-DNA glycosylase family protein [Steroidobacteraceae bacterium]